MNYRKTAQRCAVANCSYLADTTIEECGDFAVCSLHDHEATRRILERFERPAAYWSQDRPIVLPCGELTEEDLEARQAHKDATHAFDDPRMAEVSDLPTRMVHENWDLTR